MLRSNGGVVGWINLYYSSQIPWTKWLFHTKHPERMVVFWVPGLYKWEVIFESLIHVFMQISRSFRGKFSTNSAILCVGFIFFYPLNYHVLECHIRQPNLDVGLEPGSR